MAECMQLVLSHVYWCGRELDITPRLEDSYMQVWVRIASDLS